MINEVLAQIRAPNFTAGIVLFDDVVVETAPIVRYTADGWIGHPLRKDFPTMSDQFPNVEN